MQAPSIPASCASCNRNGRGYSSAMDIGFPDIVGFVGVGFIVSTYFLSQVGRMDVTRPLYPGINALGALLILYSLYHSFNPASFVIEMFWLVISTLGFIRASMRRNR